MRYHLPHPTQAAACGAPASVLVVSFEELQAKPEALRCKRCLKVHAALEAGRPVYRGLEPAALEVSELTDAELAGAVESYRRGLSIEQIANSSRFYGRFTPEQIRALVVPALERLQEGRRF